jgi:hypothetical protein
MAAEAKDPKASADGLGLESRQYEALEQDFQEASCRGPVLTGAKAARRGLPGVRIVAASS